MSKQNIVIYQVFVRNHSKEGTFLKLIEDLDRIKDLGVDIIYLLPIHEIGKLNRKGTYGSPYAIKDYFSISPDLGTLSDFKKLISEVHQRGMRIIMDMVFNHTSPDNHLTIEHPEYYFYKNGKRGNQIGDWSDVVDLETTRKDTQDYLLSVLKYWRSLGVDGYRFDVASLIPLEFFKRAREELGKDVFLLAECVDPWFANYLKNINHLYVSDIELAQYFDCLYNYHWLAKMSEYLNGKDKLESIVSAIKEDDPRICRINCVENHDRDRITSYFKSEEPAKEWARFSFDLKGIGFIYAGQEYGVSHKPELFEKDPIVWPKENEMYAFYKELISKKHNQKEPENDISIKDGKVLLNGKLYSL